MTSKTNLGLVQWCHNLVGEAYWYGCCVYNTSESLLKRKAEQYPSHYQESRMARYRADIRAKKKCSDCIGLVKGYYWMRDDGTTKYGLDGRPDKGANGMFQAAKVSGPIATLPEIPGLLLYSPGHAGVYIGGGWAIEARGFAYGIVKTKVSERKWTHWYQCPYIDYVDGDVPLPPIVEPSQRTLRVVSGSLMRGDDVREVQTRLVALGFAPGTVDGIYGTKTETAVKAFQKSVGLEVNGVVGSQTWAKLEETPEAPAPEKETETGENQSGEGSPEAGGDKEPDDSQPAISYDYGTRLLKYTRGRTMLKGEDVRNVQTRLVELGYVPGKIDGIYGPSTAAAVKVFQEDSGLVVDGIVGPKTRTKL